ncbi:MAG TPA: hypothetical protein VFE09_09685 [Rubrobacteraceae bacterium]|nr:hypothetical protein [Rubrobacteraceae bacterium]
MFIYGGDDRVRALRGNDYVSGGRDQDTVYGGTGNDVINGGSEGDTLYGNFGNDTLIGGSGTDTMSGGDGDDKIFAHDGTAAKEDVDCGPGTNDFAVVDKTDTVDNCERVVRN